MDKTFHEVQAKVAKRLIHSDRHRRRSSIAPDLVTCKSKNHDLSRLMVKNEILFKDLEDQMCSLQNEQRRRESELLRSERSLAGSLCKKSLPQLKHNLHTKTPLAQGKNSALKQPKRHSLIEDELSSTSSNQLVQEWLQSFDTIKTTRNFLDVPSFFHARNEPQSSCSENNEKSDFDSKKVEEINN